MSNAVLLVIAGIAGAGAAAVWIAVDCLLRIKASRARFYEEYRRRKGRG